MITDQQRATLADIRKLEGRHVSPHMVLELVGLIERLAGPDIYRDRHGCRWHENPPPEHVIQDREALLKYELSLVHKAFQQECEPVIAQLTSIEMMKPPKPFKLVEPDITQTHRCTCGGKLIRYMFEGGECFRCTACGEEYE